VSVIVICVWDLSFEICNSSGFALTYPFFLLIAFFCVSLCANKKKKNLSF